MYEDVKTNKVSYSIYHRGINLRLLRIKKQDIEYVCKKLLMDWKKLSFTSGKEKINSLGRYRSIYHDRETLKTIS